MFCVRSQPCRDDGGGEMDPLDAGDGGWYPALMRNAWRYRYGVDKGAIYPSPSGKRGGPFRN